MLVSLPVFLCYRLCSFPNNIGEVWSLRWQNSLHCSISRICIHCASCRVTSTRLGVLNDSWSCLGLLKACSEHQYKGFIAKPSSVPFVFSLQWYQRIENCNQLMSFLLIDSWIFISMFWMYIHESTRVNQLYLPNVSNNSFLIQQNPTFVCEDIRKMLPKEPKRKPLNLTCRQQQPSTYLILLHK